MRRRHRRFVIGVLLLLPIILIGAHLSAQQTPPTGLEYHYNAAGHVAEILNFDAPEEQNLTQFSYDGYGRLSGLVSALGQEHEFEYDAFGRLMIWQNPALGRLEYRYDGEQLVQVMVDGRSSLVLSAVDSPLLLVKGEQVRWELFDGLGTLRQTFIGEHSSGSSVNQSDVFGLPLVDLAEAEIPLELPIFEGMLYEPETGIYISLTGRAYDPISGRFLQRDALGPDASGNLYGYRFERLSLPVQHADPLPFGEGLRALIEVQQQVPNLDAESVRQQHLPEFSLAWEDKGLAALRRFNNASAARINQYADLPMWLGYQYNPSGVVLTSANDFTFQRTPGPGSMNKPLNPISILEMPLESLLQTDIRPPRWYAPEAWRSSAVWGISPDVPQPSRGSRAPDALADYLPNLPHDMEFHAALFSTLDNLPVQEVDVWLEDIDAATLPQSPKVPPLSGDEWLRQWFSEDTFSTWTLLDYLTVVPEAPGAAPIKLDD